MEEKNAKRAKATNFVHQRKKQNVPKIYQRTNDVYISSKSNFKALHKDCVDLLNSGITHIYLHCLGNAINRGINLALNICNNSNGALSYVINTSTIQIIDELLPLFDNDDLTFNGRNNSAVHIKIFRNILLDIDSETV